MVSREYVCSVCDKIFGNSGHLYRHQRIHSAEKPIRCTDPTCNRTFARADNMRRHATNHIPPEEHQFSCNVMDCGKRFPSEESFRRHSKIHDEKNWRYQCPHCERMFMKKHQRIAHLYHEHQVPMPYRCEVEGCSEQFFRKCDADSHFKKKHIPKEFFCLHEDCIDLPAFDKLSVLNEHMKTVHTAKVSCPDCGRNFPRAQSLRKHREVHSIPFLDRYTFKCEYLGCNARYTKATNLYMHVRAKHKMVTYDCKMCDTGCTTRFGLKRHYILIHEMEEEKAMELSGQKWHKRKQRTGSSSNAECDDVIHQPRALSKKPRVSRRKHAKNRIKKDEDVNREETCDAVCPNPSNNHIDANPEHCVEESDQESEEHSKLVVELKAQMALPESPKPSRRIGNSGRTRVEGSPDIESGSDTRLNRGDAVFDGSTYTAVPEAVPLYATSPVLFAHELPSGKTRTGGLEQQAGTVINPDEEAFLACLRAQANLMKPPNLFPEFGCSQSENSSCAEEAPPTVSA